MSTARKCLVTIPAFGSNQLTHALLPDVARESDLVDLLIVDNGGHYEKVADEWVIRPESNLGWAGGSNLGFRVAFGRGYDFAVTLNNDTRLSPGFFAGLLDPRLPDDLGIAAPVYDGWWPTQRSSTHTGPAGLYEPVDFFRKTEFVDGTALMMSASAWERVGGLDERAFGRFAWGADIDLSIRVRGAGLGVYVTERSFVQHFGMVSASETFGKHRYFMRAKRDKERALRRLHGRATLREINKASPQRMPLEDRDLRAVNPAPSIIHTSDATPLNQS